MADASHTGGQAHGAPGVIRLTDDEAALLASSLTGGSFDVPEPAAQQPATTQPSAAAPTVAAPATPSVTQPVPVSLPPTVPIPVAPVAAPASRGVDVPLAGGFGTPVGGPVVVGAPTGAPVGADEPVAPEPLPHRVAGPGLAVRLAERFGDLWALDAMLVVGSLVGLWLVFSHLDAILLGIARAVFVLLSSALRLGLVLALVTVVALMLRRRRRW